MKITAIMSGGDWSDASVKHVVLPEGILLSEAKKEYDLWYRNEFLAVNSQIRGEKEHL